MNKNYLKIFVILILLNATTLFFARMPVIYTIIIDSSASVSEPDFSKANEAVALFLELLYQKSQALPGSQADWVSIAWFGGNNEYYQSPYYNCSENSSIKTLQYLALYATHPKLDHTAIYSAIGYSLYNMVKMDGDLPGDYLKITVMITDGEDNNSPDDHKALIKQLYPNIYNYLFVVGVGNNAKISEFASLTSDNNIYNIDNFDQLGAILAIIGEFIEKNLFNRLN